MIEVLKTASNPGGRQLLLSGRVADSIYGRSVPDAALVLEYDAEGSGEFQSLPARLARRDDGWFGFHLAPQMLPQPTGARPALRLSASAPNHDAAVRTLEPDPAELILAASDRTIAGHSIRVERITGAPFRQFVTLAPRPVALEVTVLAAGDPASPVTGADVELQTPPGASAVTDASGSCRFAALPVAETVTFRVTRGGNLSEHTVRPDFDRSINRVVFAVPL